MAQANYQPQLQAQAQTESHSQVEAPFSLAPSIFTPFPGLSNDPTPADQGERLVKILQNLQTQHDGVRQNMIGLLEARRKFLVRKAEEELRDLEGVGGWREEGLEEGLFIEDTASERERWQARKDQKVSLEEMMRSVRVKAREGAKGEDYEAKPVQAINPMPAIPGDVEMGGIGSRNVTQIRTSLSHDLLDLVERGIGELEAYDNHASNATEFYKQALARCKRRSGSMAGPSPIVTTGGGGRILKNAREQNPANMQTLRRLM